MKITFNIKWLKEKKNEIWNISNTFTKGSRSNIMLAKKKIYTYKSPIQAFGNGSVNLWLLKLQSFLIWIPLLIARKLEIAQAGKNRNQYCYINIKFLLAFTDCCHSGDIPTSEKSLPFSIKNYIQNQLSVINLPRNWTIIYRLYADIWW